MANIIRSDKPDENDFPSLYEKFVTQVRERALFFTDREGRIASWNPGVEHLLGYTREEFVNQPVALLFSPEDREKGLVDEELECAAREGHAIDVRWHVKKDKSFIFADGLVVAIKDASGDLLGYAKVLQDATARKRSEE